MKDKAFFVPNPPYIQPKLDAKHVPARIFKAPSYKFLNSWSPEKENNSVHHYANECFRLRKLLREGNLTEKETSVLKEELDIAFKLSKSFF